VSESERVRRERLAHEKRLDALFAAGKVDEAQRLIDRWTREAQQQRRQDARER
jgi:uncharacterized protein YhaN